MIIYNDLKKNNVIELKKIEAEPSMDVLDSYVETECEMTRMTPVILKKKINDKPSIIPLKTPNNLGHIRHFPATTKE
jgi:hypothetical protein